jgi:hypothetical protein
MTGCLSDLVLGWYTYGLAQWSALSNGNLITFLDTESWRDVRSKVLVSLLISGVFWDEVKVFSADDERSVHLGGDDSSGQDTATDGNKTGERAFLVCNEKRQYVGLLCFYPHDASGSSPRGERESISSFLEGKTPSAADRASD